MLAIKSKMKTRKSLTGYLFVLPLVIVILVFLVFPICKAALMSVQYWYMPNVTLEKGNYFVGLDNFVSVLNDSHFVNSVEVTLIYMVVTVVARFLLGLGAALLLNKKFAGRGLARALIIIPWAVPEVVACLVWILMYDKDFGIINYLGMNLGLFSEALGFLTDMEIALPAAMAVNIWKGFPFVAIMLLAGLQSIPSELYEAARVDGANPFQQFRSITMPSLRPVTIIIFLLLIVWTIKDFGICFLLARGGPSRATEILTIYIYKTAFSNFDFGKAAAGGMLMLLFSAIFTVFYMRVLKKENDL